MCGICGYVHHDLARPVNHRQLEIMNDTLTHRGPDSDGIHTQDGVALAMRRLSIIDVEGGDQPIFNEDNTIAVVFNGEIYNFQETCDLLSKSGHTFNTDTDTEVIIHAYEQWGVDCLAHLNGMFAFAIWDDQQKRLFVARDRTGIKPLYYAHFDDSVIFASELKALLHYPNFPRDLDYQALNEYLTFEYVPAPRSIFKHAQKLPPGHALLYENGQLKVWQYWDMQLEESETSPLDGTLQDLATQLRLELRDVVNHEMISDVPLGVMLSGGIDSSSIAALMVELSSQPVRSFSISFEDASFDESKYARLVSDHLGTEHYEHRLTAPQVLDLLPRVGQFMDEPLADSSFVPTMLLAQHTRQFVTVALGGDGGDEIWGGYSTLQAHRLMALYANTVPNPLRRLTQAAVNRLPTSFNNISLDFKLKRFANGDQYPLEYRHQYWLGSFDAKGRRHILRNTRYQSTSETFGLVSEHMARCVANLPLNRILYLDMKMYLDGDILPKVDRASMSQSLEVRVPFLNHKILNFAQRIPVNHKLRGLTTKAILREAMRNDLPPEILARGKKGFNMPVARWLTQELRDWTTDLLAYDRIKRQNIFNPESVQQLLNDHMNSRRDGRKQLWTLLIFQMWLDNWGG